MAAKNGAATICESPNAAFTVCGPLMMTVQEPAPLHAPDHAFRAEPPAGVAVSTTDVPWLKLAAHVPGQAIPGGLLVTLPLAPPLLVTLTNRGCTGTKLAVTDCAAVMVKVQVPAPAHTAELQPAKAEPDAGVAVSVIAVPLL